MGANEIKIIIGGDPSGFQKAARDVSGATDRMRNSFKDAASAVKPFDNAANSAAEGLKKITPGANQAATSLNNLGRIAQDAPFGFIGIQNNINPLLESFQRLKQETGSTGAAFKALGSSLIGAGGLGLAVSIVTSALTFFALSARGGKEQLEGYAKAIDEANKKAGDELARVQVLNAVITDNTRKQTERKDASAELSKILDDLNIKMTKEEILNGNVAKATQLATAAIIERAKARAAEARIGELSGQQLQRDQKRIELTEKLTTAQRNLAAVQAAQKAAGSGGTVPGIGGNAITAQLAVKNIADGISEIDKQTASANKEIQRLVGLISSNDLTVDISGDTEKQKKDIDLLKQRIEALKQLQSLTGLTAAQQVELAQLEIQLASRDAVKLGFTPDELKQQIEGILEKAFPVKTFEFNVDAQGKINTKPLTDGFKTDIAKATGNQKIEIGAPKFFFTNLKNSTDEATKKIKETLFNSIVNGMQEASSVLGELFSNIISGESLGASFAKAAQGLLSVVGGVLQDVGKQMVITSQAVQVLKEALNGLFGPGGGAAGLAAGLLLIGAGAALKNIKFDVPKFADGGIVNKATLGVFGERGPEAIMPLDKLPGMLRNVSAANTMQVILQPSIRFSMTDFSLGLERVANQRKRLG